MTVGLNINTVILDDLVTHGLEERRNSKKPGGLRISFGKYDKGHLSTGDRYYT